MDDERFVTSLLQRFSDPETGWIVVRNTGSLIFVTEFIRLFENFIRQAEPHSPRRLRQLPWLRRTVVRCLDGWNILRNQDARTTDDIATVELVGEHLTNVEVLRKGFNRNRIPRRRVFANSFRGRGGGPRRNFPPRNRPEFFPPRPRDDTKRETIVPMKGEVSVRNEIAGAIIGRKGKTISSIRADSGCHLHVCECKDGWSRVIEIYGTKDQVIEAHRLVNVVIRKEYPEYLGKRERAEMVTTVELKMGIALATYLTGMNSALLAEIQEKTGIVTTLHGVDGEEDSKKVRLTGNIERILDAHRAVMAILDTYEEWKAANTHLDHDQGTGQEGGSHGMNTDSTPVENGDLFQTSSVYVLQPDGSYKEMQIWVQQPPPGGVASATGSALTPPTLVSGREPQTTSFQYSTTPATGGTPRSDAFTLANTTLGKLPQSVQQQYHSLASVEEQQQQQQGRMNLSSHTTRQTMMTGQQETTGLPHYNTGNISTGTGTSVNTNTGGFPQSYQTGIDNTSTAVYTPSNVPPNVGGYSQLHVPDQGQVIILPSETQPLLYNTNDDISHGTTTTQSTYQTRMTPF